MYRTNKDINTSSGHTPDILKVDMPPPPRGMGKNLTSVVDTDQA